MKHIEWDFLLNDRPDLNLPEWWQLADYQMDRVLKLNREQVVTWRTAELLVGYPGEDPWMTGF